MAACDSQVIEQCKQLLGGSRFVSTSVLREVLKSLFEGNETQANQLLVATGFADGESVDTEKFFQWVFRSEAKKRIAVYGGAFDPVTNSHLTMAAQIVQSQCADEVWMIPSGPRPDKPKLKTPAVDRYCMCQVAVNTFYSVDFPVKVSDLECQLEEALATYDLLCALRDKHPDCNFSFVIGSDWLQPGTNLAEWDSKNWDWKPGDPPEERKVVTGHKMLAEFDFLVVHRPGYDVDKSPDDPTGLLQFGPRMSWMKMPPGVTFIEGNLSSSEIRKRATLEARVHEAVANHAETSTEEHLKAIEGLLPRAVLAYIRRHGFYMPPDPPAMPRARQRVAVYGGAFDPITNSHLTCAAEIIHSGCVDHVWLVPCGPRPDKPNLKTLPLDRYCMCKIAVNFAFSVVFPVRVSDIECFATESFATYDLLCSLRDKHPDLDFSFVIGSDWLQPGSSMADWTSKNWDWKEGDPEDQKTIVTGQKMLKEFDFLVIKRPGYDVTETAEDPTGLKQFGPRLTWMHMPSGMTFIEGNLSSTELRKRHHWNAQWGLDGLTPPGVIAYMHRRGLYN